MKAKLTNFIKNCLNYFKKFEHNSKTECNKKINFIKDSYIQYELDYIQKIQKITKLIVENLNKQIEKKNIDLLEDLLYNLGAKKIIPKVNSKDINPNECFVLNLETLNDVKSGSISKVLRVGWKIENFIIQPALITVVE